MMEEDREFYSKFEEKKPYYYTNDNINRVYTIVELMELLPILHLYEDEEDGNIIVSHEERKDEDIFIYLNELHPSIKKFKENDKYFWECTYITDYDSQIMLSTDKAEYMINAIANMIICLENHGLKMVKHLTNNE